jgi:hypothetical protein
VRAQERAPSFGLILWNAQRACEHDAALQAAGAGSATGDAGV